MSGWIAGHEDRGLYIYICDTTSKSRYEPTGAGSIDPEYREYLIENSLAHYTKEAAIAHTNAMIRVSEYAASVRLIDLLYFWINYGKK